jgi:hypothetical protein
VSSRTPLEILPPETGSAQFGTRGLGGAYQGAPVDALFSIVISCRKALGRLCGGAVSETTYPLETSDGLIHAESTCL